MPAPPVGATWLAGTQADMLLFRFDRTAMSARFLNNGWPT